MNSNRTEYAPDPADLNDRGLAFTAMAVGLALLVVAGAFFIAGVVR